MSRTSDPPAQRSPYLESDVAFDVLYPVDIQRASRRYWTPVAVAARAAILLHEAGATRVLDVGSGAGKFALVAAATVPELRVVGVEQRGHLVDVARLAQKSLGLENVRFVFANASEVSWKEYDAFYFYNSFAENLFDPFERLDDAAVLSVARFARDVKRATANLRAAPVGTRMATFHGSSTRVPASFELTRSEPAGTGLLRLWTKRTDADDGSFFVEVGDALVRHDRSGVPM